MGLRHLQGIEAFNHAVAGGELSNVQLGRGLLSGILGGVSLGDVYLGFGRLDKPVRSRGVYNPDGYNLGVMLEMPRPGQFWGASAERGSLVVGLPGQECDSATPGPFAFGYLVAPPAVWEATATALVPNLADSLLSKRGVFHPSSTDTGRLTRRFGELFAAVAAGWPGLGEPAAAGAVRDELFRLFARTAGAGVEAEPCGRFFRHQRLVRLVEDHLQTREGEAVYVQELCRVADVSERTLNYAFREILGLSPMEYLRRLRLSAIRRELLAADPKPGTVTRTAFKWGFWHLGEFAAAYRRLFGEAPSETLRRGNVRLLATERHRVRAQ